MDRDNAAYPGYVSNCERFVVGRALLDPSYYTTSGLCGNHFGDSRLGLVWDVLGEMIVGGAEISVDTVAATLDREGRLKWAGGLGLLCQLPLMDGSALGSPDVIRNAWLVREATTLTQVVPNMLERGLSGDEILGHLRNRIDEITRENTRSVPTLDEASVAELRRIREDYGRISTGVPVNVGLPSGLGLEAYVPGGIPRDKLTLIFGETGTFKTCIKQNIIDAIAIGCPDGLVLDFSLEDSVDLTTQRYLSRISDVPYSRIAARTFEPGDLRKLEEAYPAAQAAARRVRVVGDVPGSINEALRLVQQYKRDGLVAVFVDYLQLMSTEWDEIVNILTKMQVSAKVDKVAWVVVSQVKQEKIEEREDHRPRLTDVYGGPGIRMCPKLALGIYRPYRWATVPGPKSKYHEMYANHPNGEALYADTLEVIIRKNVLGTDEAVIPVLVDRPTGLVRKHEYVN